MKKLFLIFGYLVIASQLFMMDLPILNVVLGGFTVKYILYYSFIIISVVAWGCKLVYKKSAPIYEWLLIPFMLFPTLMGLLHGVDVMTVFADFSLYCMPIAVYMWAKIAEPKARTSIVIFLWLCIVAAVVSVFVSTGVLKTDIWASEGMLVRTAGAVDSTLLFGGVVLCLVLLFTRVGEDKRINRLFLYVSLIASVLGSLLAQSRTRIVLILVCALVVCLFNFYDGKASKTLKLTIGLILVAIAVYYIFRENIEALLTQIFDRFLGTGFGEYADVNVSARQNEQQLQLEAFASSPVLGLGFGTRVLYGEMYVHNVYTSFLMQTGFIGALIYFFWLGNFVLPSVKRIIKKTHNVYDVVISFFFTALVVLSFTNAAFLQSGGYFMLLIVFLLSDRQQCEEKN